MDFKRWYSSRTVWIAIVQGIVGIVTAILASNPELQTVGAVVTLKSALDIILRYLTTKPIID